ncbi:MAG: stage II sporulation protein M [Calditrichaeota bacterium]|nr:stage II sporulation protein M [Calditrichota bacterium]
MRETVFIKNNIDKWQAYESGLKENRSFSADEISEMYLQVTEDLSYARTFYPASKITSYLNNLAVQVHQLIYKNKKERTDRFKKFWFRELPGLFYDARKEIRLSLIIFLLSILIGVVSSANDDSFVRLIMGDAYVNMTEANINKDDPMAVYKKMNETEMFFGITFNNLRVSFIAFAFGAIFGLGTAFILIQNGIMLGAFQYFFYQKGLLWTSFLTIWIHGTLEISTIVIEGAAGFLIGKALLFPKSFSRIDALKIEAKKGIKIVIGVAPIIILAGFLEGFVTRHTEFATVTKLAIILLSATFVVFYYWLFPMKVKQEARRNG